MNRRQALLVARNFPPLVGGMERLFWHVYQELDKTFTSTIIGPTGCGRSIANPERAHECTPVPATRFLACAFRKAFAAATQEKFDLYISASGVTAPVAWLGARTHRAPCVTLVHGLDLIAANAAYQHLFLPFIRRCDLVIANSQNTATLARNKGVSPARIAVLNPGVDLPEIRGECGRFRLQHGLGDRPILLSVGRLIQRKGLPEFITHALPKIIRSHPDVILVVIGEEATQAFHRTSGELVRIRAAISQSRVQDHVALLGRADDSTLTSAYQDANVFVFPTLDLPGDVEGFGMVALEAASFGLPTVGFSVGGVADAVGVDKSGILVPPNDYATYADSINRLLAGNIDSINQGSCRKYAARFSWERYGDRLRELCLALLASRTSSAP